jgi:uncharacterized Zn-finger protein
MGNETEIVCPYCGKYFLHVVGHAKAFPFSEGDVVSCPFCLRASVLLAHAVSCNDNKEG